MHNIRFRKVTSILFCNDTYYRKNDKGDTLAYGAFPYALWQERFLPHCDTLTVIGRKKPFSADLQDDNLDISNGPHVSHILLPNINSPIKRLTQGQTLYKRIENEVAKVDAVILRGPTEFAMMAAKAARKLGKPYAVEMSGCAFDHTWHHGSLIGNLYAPIKYLRARNMVKNAERVIYVTQYFLQRRYPTNGHTTFASNVEITAPPQKVLGQRLQRIKTQKSPQKIGLIGNYGNHLKGIGVALKALKALKDSGGDFTLHVLGKGDPKQWENTIKRYGLNVSFDGTRPGGEPVMEWLDSMDIYIQPSFHEGLPRAVIEAMSRGLPCLTSNAGGTDELLPTQCIHKKGNHKALAKTLISIWDDKDWQVAQSTANAKHALNYTKEALAPRRHKFWKELKEKWWA